MTVRTRIRRRAFRWAARHRFPLRRELLVQHHLLPAARLRYLSDLLIPRAEGDSVEVVELSDGRRFELDLRSLAQRAIAYELSDEVELELLRELLRDGDVAFDVGANIGLYSVAMARATGPSGGVYAFEPHPTTADRLERNLRLNNLENVHVSRAAVSSAGGEAVLRVPDLAEPGLATITGRGEALATVSTVTLDAVAAEHGVTRIALLKLDAEGAEEAILAGAAELLANRSIQRILFETLDGSVSVQAQLVEMGYRLEVVLPPGEASVTRPCSADEHFAYANILASL